MDERELREYCARNVMTATEAAEELGVSKQRLNSLVKDSKLIPLRKSETGATLFYRPEVEERKKAAAEYRK